MTPGWKNPGLADSPIPPVTFRLRRGTGEVQRRRSTSDFEGDEVKDQESLG